MSRSQKTLLFALTQMVAPIMSALLAVTAASAQTREAREQASQFFERGEKSLEQCNYDEAIRNFTEAYRIAPHPVTYYYLGMAHFRNGNQGEALHYFRKYMYAVEQESVPADEEQLASVRQKIGTLDKEVKAQAVREADRIRFENLYKSVVGLLDTLIDKHGKAVAAPYLQRYMEVTARDITAADPDGRRDTIRALERLEAQIRGELGRSPTTGSWFWRGSGIFLTTAGLITLGVGVKMGIDGAGTAESDMGAGDDRTIHAMGLGGAGLLAAVLGLSLYRYGKVKPKPPLLNQGISILPGQTSGMTGIFARGSF